MYIFMFYYIFIKKNVHVFWRFLLHKKQKKNNYNIKKTKNVIKHKNVTNTKKLKRIKI